MEEADIQNAIVEHLNAQAVWRADKADEYPEDDRNARAAKTFENLAYDLERVGKESKEYDLLSELTTHARETRTEDAYVYLALDGEDTSALHLWNYGEPTLLETLTRIKNSTISAWEELAETT